MKQYIKQKQCEGIYYWTRFQKVKC